MAYLYQFCSVVWGSQNPRNSSVSSKFHWNPPQRKIVDTLLVASWVVLLEAGFESLSLEPQWIRSPPPQQVNSVTRGVIIIAFQQCPQECAVFLILRGWFGSLCSGFFGEILLVQPSALMFDTSESAFVLSSCYFISGRLNQQFNYCFHGADVAPWIWKKVFINWTISLDVS